MKIAECNHIRIRDGNDYNMNVERMIKHFEAQYNLDFRSLPQWEKLVQRMHLSITDCKRKIQGANRRKTLIINKLYQEFCRPSPFELTDNFARTNKMWQSKKNLNEMKKRISLSTPTDSASIRDELGYDEMVEETSAGPPNTENNTSAEVLATKDEIMSPTETVSHLPTFICINQHKLISALGSKESSLSRISNQEVLDIKSDVKLKEWLLLKKCTKVVCFPKKIILSDKSLEDQIVTFSLLNCTLEYLNLRYMGVTDEDNFRRAKILPVTPLKLYPGLAVTFKFLFRFQNQQDFSTYLYFRVGQKVLAEAPIEALCVPIASVNICATSISVPDIVNIPPMYFWRINAKNGFPKSAVTIDVTGDCSYDLHVSKVSVDLTEDLQVTHSVDPMSPTTESMILREEDQEVITESKALLPPTDADDTESLKITDIIILLIEECIEKALDIFVFERTYLFVKPNSKQRIPVYLTKPEHIGYHQSFYELEFNDPETNGTVFSKTIKVFGEVLPNPIQVQPILLDMTQSPVIHGFCEDRFTISNSHKLYPVTIKIKLTTKISKLIRVVPMETLLPAKSSVDFLVRFCSKDLRQSTREDLVHLTFKIIVVGDKSVYRNLPPLFYEVIAPCSSEFKKLYNKKFYNEFPEPSQIELEDVAPLELAPLKSQKN
ncbi:uncharacterized protein [Choristoneura fumiferana]|uniref:uncharacterized protein n=1 Tax=Choristoneura fumiferana TaxID=7141 RepID=UPI003D15C7B6